MVNGNKIKPEVVSSPDSEMYINDLVNGQGILNLNNYGYSYYANIYKVEFLPNGSNYNVTALIHIYRIFSKKITLMKALSVVLYSTSSSSGTVTLSTPISSYLRYWPGRSDVAILRVNISFTSGGSASIRLVLKIDNDYPFGCTVNDDYFYGFIGYYQNWERYLYRIRNYSNYFEIYKHDVHGRNYGPSLGNVFQLPNTKVIENTAGSVDPMSVITWETNSVKIYKFTDPSENTDSVSTLSFTQRIIYSHTYNYSSGPYARCVLARHNECLLADTQNNKLYYIDSSNITSTSFRHSYNHICIGFNSFIYYILEVNGEQYYLDIYKVTNGQISNITYLSIGSNLGTFSNNFFNATTAIDFQSGDYITMIQTSKNIIFLKINGTTASVLRIVSLEKIYMLSNNSKFTNIQAIYKPNMYSVGSIVTIPNSNAQSMTIYDDSPVKMNNRFKIQTFSV